MKNKTLWIILAVVVVLGGYVWTTYNSFVSLNTAVDGQWAQVETVYQRRFDLIPNLVAATQGAMKQEQKVFGDIAAARASYSGAKTVDAKAAAASQVESSVGTLISVIVENYPQLNVSGGAVSNLMVELAGSENRISTERQRFNDAVGAMNIKAQRFPSNIVASLFGFNTREFFKSVSGAEVAPKVNL